MHGVMVNYYIFKDVINELPSQISEKKELMKDDLFNFANFNTTPWFYCGFHKKDKYDLFNKLNGEKFNLFYADVLANLAKDLSYEKLIFVYGIYVNHLVYKKMGDYINALKANNTNYYEAYNMLDYYFANKFDNIDLKKTNLRMYFENGFTYYPFMDELIHNPLLRNFDIFQSNSYMKKSYNKKKNFYDFCTKSKFGFKKLLFKIGGSFRHNKKTKYYFYNNKIDTRLLNLVENEYEIDNKIYKYNLEKYIKEIKIKAISDLKVINSYLFLNEDKKLRNLLNLPKDKII